MDLPFVPMTVEAMLLHYLDNLDAQVRGALTTIEKNGGEGSWTEYVKLLDRFIYRGAPSRIGRGGMTGWTGSRHGSKSISMPLMEYRAGPRTRA